MKGRVDADIAREAAFQAWAARELLLRLRRDNSLIDIAIAAERTDDRGHFVAVVGRHPKARDLVIGCGFSPNVLLFERERDQLFAAVRSGALDERKLLERFRQSGAWQNRESIMGSLDSYGHPYDRSDIDQIG